MDRILGPDNGFKEYLLVLLIYLLVFLLIRYPRRIIELNERSSFLLLFLSWSVFIFVGNYIGYLLGAMSFLPWLNNLIHSFGWVGIGLTWLYFSSRELPWYYRFFLSAMYSFIIKFMENDILGSWQFDPYLMFNGKWAYIIIMSAVDGFYPVLSDLLLRSVHKKFPSIYFPE
ncbi:MAG: hypothetical protein ACHQEM_08545 [Chitinophagales bacterium]